MNLSGLACVPTVTRTFVGQTAQTRPDDDLFFGHGLANSVPGRFTAIMKKLVSLEFRLFSERLIAATVREILTNASSPSLQGPNSLWQNAEDTACLRARLSRCNAL